MTYFDLSPDGMSVVYSTCNYPRSTEASSGDYEFELETVNIDGTDMRRQTTNAAYDNYPVWSPDGERIAFVTGGSASDRIAKKVAIYTMAAEGGDRRLEGTGATHHAPQWSPDGERIAYVGVDEDEGRAIYVVVADGSLDEKRLTGAASGPTWSPDGERIAFAKVDGDEVALYTIGADGTEARRLTVIDGWQPGAGEPDPARAWIRKVSWSPDGTKILFLVNTVDYDRRYSEIHVIGADGGGVARVSVRNPLRRLIDDAEWAPDGKRIAMSGELRASGRSQDYDPTAQIALVTVAADGTDVRVLVGRQRDGGLIGLGVERGDISAHVAACGDGVAVADPESNPGLVEDCEALLDVQNALAGPDGLKWFVEWSMSEWEGVEVGGTPPRVRGVVLRSRGVAGEIPTELSRLTELRVLDMSRNALMGEIPSELGELKSLEGLDLRNNYLSGEIPAELSGLRSLRGLSLGANDLGGEIPVELSELGGLTGLLLGSNDLEGEIPVELRRLTQLRGLDLSGNRLRGGIPEELGALTELRHLDLSYNELTGEIPAELGRLARLERLYLHYNRLTGEIPAELGELTNLTGLNITSELNELGLIGNRFSGCIPGGLRDIRETDEGALELPDC